MTAKRAEGQGKPSVRDTAQQSEPHRESRKDLRSRELHRPKHERSAQQFRRRAEGGGADGTRRQWDAERGRLNVPQRGSQLAHMQRHVTLLAEKVALHVVDELLAACSERTAADGKEWREARGEQRGTCGLVEQRDQAEDPTQQRTAQRLAVLL